MIYIKRVHQNRTGFEQRQPVKNNQRVILLLKIKNVLIGSEDTCDEKVRRYKSCKGQPGDTSGVDTNEKRVLLLRNWKLYVHRKDI